MLNVQGYTALMFFRKYPQIFPETSKMTAFEFSMLNNPEIFQKFHNNHLGDSTGQNVQNFSRTLRITALKYSGLTRFNIFF